jgi:DeoR/GlpR family transcriptional regulator of sugar metabolism
MIAHTRTQALLTLLEQEREVPVHVLAAELQISESTVRRDLSKLAESGRVCRTHGGAFLRREALQETSFIEKRESAVEEKREIAKKVAADISQGSTVFIDSGTTCLEVARCLFRRSDCRIFTNSLPVLVEACQSQATVTALGGEVRSISRALIGSGALSGLESLRLDIAIIGASGLHPEDGAFTTETMEASVKNCAIQRSRETWLVADSSKWKKAAALRFAKWSDFQRWYRSSENGITFTSKEQTPALY